MRSVEGISGLKAGEEVNTTASRHSEAPRPGLGVRLFRGSISTLPKL
jgi:hypothetical protein